MSNEHSGQSSKSNPQISNMQCEMVSRVSADVQRDVELTRANAYIPKIEFDDSIGLDGSTYHIVPSESQVLNRRDKSIK